MYQYYVYGIHVISDIEIKVLIPFSSAYKTYGPTLTISQGIIPEEQKTLDDRYVRLSDTISYLKNDYCYLLAENGTSLTYENRCTPPSSYLSAYLLGWGMSMIFHQRQLLPVHCSCVANETGAFLISGNSGSGKSTTTTHLLDQGFSFMADDLAMVGLDEEGQAIVYPAFPYQKLCRNVAEQKYDDLNELVYIDEDKDKFLAPFQGDFQLDPAPVKGLIILHAGNHPEVVTETILSINKLYAGLDCLFMKCFFGEDKFNPKMGQIVLKVASKVPFYHISRPRDQDTLNEVLHTVDHIIASQRSS